MLYVTLTTTEPFILIRCVTISELAVWASDPPLLSHHFVRVCILLLYA